MISRVLASIAVLALTALTHTDAFSLRIIQPSRFE